MCENGAGAIQQVVGNNCTDMYTSELSLLEQINGRTNLL